MSDKEELVHKTKLNRKQAADFIQEVMQSLVNGLREGKLELNRPGLPLEIIPEEEVKVNFKCKSSEEKTKLSLQLSWKHPNHVELDHDDDEDEEDLDSNELVEAVEEQRAQIDHMDHTEKE